MTDPQFIDLTYPVRGLDEQAAVGGQPADTTTTGVNVRSLDPRTRRLRGGSRCGLSKYISTTPGGLTSETQHLAVLTTASTDGLPTEEERVWFWLHPPPWFPPGTPPPPVPPLPPPEDPKFPIEYPPPWIEDPHEPEIKNPPKGGGDQVPTDADPPGDGDDVGWVYEQKKFFVTAGLIGTSHSGEYTLTGTQDNQLLLVAIYYFSDVTAGVAYEPNVALSGGGLTWNALDRAQWHYPGFPGSFDVNLRVYWARNTTAGDITVTVDMTATGGGDAIVKWGVMMVEYSGMLTSTPFEGQEGDSGNPSPGPPHTIASGATSQNGNDRLNVMFFSTIEVFAPITNAPTPADGYTLRANVNESEDGNGQVLSARLYLIDDLSTPSGATVEPSVVCTFNPGAWTAVSATFRYS